MSHFRCSLKGSYSVFGLKLCLKNLRFSTYHMVQKIKWEINIMLQMSVCTRFLEQLYIPKKTIFEYSVKKPVGNHTHMFCFTNLLASAIACPDAKPSLVKFSQHLRPLFVYYLPELRQAFIKRIIIFRKNLFGPTVINKTSG